MGCQAVEPRRLEIDLVHPGEGARERAAEPLPHVQRDGFGGLDAVDDESVDVRHGHEGGLGDRGVVGESADDRDRHARAL